MKLMIISDTHGFLKPTEEAFRIMELEKADKMIHLGDFIYHGPRNDFDAGYKPKEIIDLLNLHHEKMAIALKGNCDSEVDEKSLLFKLRKDAIIKVKDRQVYLTHGHFFNERHIPTFLKPGDVMIRGHFHIPLLTEAEGVIVASPGSVGIPRGNSKPSYIIMDDKEMIAKSFDGEVLFEFKF
jgi:putative phosphoesterase